MDQFPKIADNLLKYLSTRDKDTFVFTTLAMLTVCGLTFGAPPWPTVGAGFGFVALYILMRYALLRVQMIEKESELKVIPAQRAEDIIEKQATESEKKMLDNMLKSDTTIGE